MNSWYAIDIAFSALCLFIRPDRRLVTLLASPIAFTATVKASSSALVPNTKQYAIHFDKSSFPCDIEFISVSLGS